MDQSKSNPFSFSADDLITPASESTQKYKILVIEDDIQVAQTLLTALARAGMECRHTTDGQVGLEALRHKDFHLLVLDLCLSQQNGQEICRQARKISTLPLIGLMDRDEQDAQVKCFGMGADDFLIAPFSPQLLLLRVASLLRRAYAYDRKKHKHPVPFSSIPMAAPLRPVAPQVLPPALMTSALHPAILHPAALIAGPVEPSKPSDVPAGWSRCDSCNYMGPTPRFQTQDGSGLPVMACPNCGEKSGIEYALG